jgi:RHS repeat-associated protein
MDTDRQYTGQRWEAGIGLYDYNARYYDPALGRFVQADTIIPNFANPQSLNRYTYVYNRSLVFADQSGHFPWPLVGVVVGGVIVGGVVGVIVTPEVLPWNPPVVFTDRVAEPITSSDMTGWLRNQMVSNAQSDVVQAIRENWTSHNIVRKDAAMQAWTALVGTGAIWDFKVDIEETSWFENGIRNVTLGNQALNFDAVANMHFGFVGRAAGFDADLLVAAAGFAQAKRALETNDPNDWGACDMSHYCDHPFATWSIEFGIYLYDLYQYRLNELDDAAFASALEEYIQKYGEPPSPPPGAISP